MRSIDKLEPNISCLIIPVFNQILVSNLIIIIGMADRHDALLR